MTAGINPLNVRSAACLLTLAISAFAQTTAPAAPQHEANFDAERKQANDLYLAGKILESLPLYEDLCRQDQTIAVFAERHGRGLAQKSFPLPPGPERAALEAQAIAEIKRAKSLGDNSLYVQQMLDQGSRNRINAIISGVPLTVGYTYAGTPEAQAAMKDAELAFGRQDYPAALKLYQRAHDLDPKWYAAPLYTGDAYFQMKDMANAGLWFQKAIDIDPDRETAYRYWADALAKSGSLAAAKPKIELAFVAEPYGKPAWIGIQQWALLTKTPITIPQVARPAFTTTNGVLNQDPALAARMATGGSAWIAYERCRVEHGGLSSQPQFIVAGATDANGQIHPSGYRHSLAEEAECLRATLAEVKAKIKSGDLDDENLDSSLKTLRRLDDEGVLEYWILLNAADVGIHADYPEFRKAHRAELAAYVDRFLLHATPPPSAAPH